MFDRTLTEMRDKIRTRQYIMTLHAEEEKDDDDLSIFDVESCILSGGINERQRGENTGEWKYRIAGLSVGGDPMETIAKISPTGKLVIITVYLL